MRLSEDPASGTMLLNAEPSGSYWSLNRGRSFMRVRSLRAALLLVAGISTSALASPAAACSTRHFYNHSDVTFTISFLGSGVIGSCSYGNSGNVPSCEIPPGQTGELHYSDVIGFLRISGPPVYPSGQFTILAGCSIEHGGNTGNVVVNDPADGDVQTCGRRSGGGYDCSR
jgi:hypothetical protein